MSSDKSAQQPLAQIVRRRIKALLDRLGSHRAPDLYRRVIREVERALIEEALQRSKGSQIQAARILGIHRNTLRARMQALGIKTLKRTR
jgi:two-component system nitrogen regulation response regulator GlnG